MVLEYYIFLDGGRNLEQAAVSMQEYYPQP